MNLIFSCKYKSQSEIWSNLENELDSFNRSQEKEIAIKLREDESPMTFMATGI